MVSTFWHSWCMYLLKRYTIVWFFYKQTFPFYTHLTPIDQDPALYLSLGFAVSVGFGYLLVCLFISLFWYIIYICPLRLAQMSHAADYNCCSWFDLIWFDFSKILSCVFALFDLCGSSLLMNSHLLLIRWEHGSVYLTFLDLTFKWIQIWLLLWLYF